MAKKVTTVSKMPASLQQKIAASQSGTAPSMVPPPSLGGKTPHFVPPKDEDAIPSISELIGDKEEVETIEALVQQQVPLNLQKKALEKTIDGINDRVKALVGQYGISKMKCSNATVSYYPTSRETIDRMLLIAKGVDPIVVDACTKTSISYTLKITGDK